MNFIIKYKDGNYYRGMCPIGPMFGAKKEDAMKFPTKRDAIQEMGKHWAFGSTEIEEVKAKP